jgi:chromosome partitioning protein
MSSARVIVVANEKGGSGKSTVAMHVAIALIKSGQSVATIDLDARQKSFTHFIENRRAWARQVARDLEILDHFSFGNIHRPTAEHEAAGCKVLTDAVDALARRCGVIVIDTPGHDNYLMRLAHSLADTLITPLNDSFVDLEVLGSVDPRTFEVSGTSHYSQMVQGAPPTPTRFRIGGVDCAAQPAFDTWFAQQSYGGQRAARAFAMAQLSLRRRFGRAGDLPGALPAGIDCRR